MKKIIFLSVMMLISACSLMSKPQMVSLSGTSEKDISQGIHAYLTEQGYRFNGETLTDRSPHVMSRNYESNDSYLGYVYIREESQVSVNIIFKQNFAKEQHAGLVDEIGKQLKLLGVVDVQVRQHER